MSTSGRLLLFVWVLTIGREAGAQTFRSFLDATSRLPSGARQTAVDVFLRDHPSSPIVENDTTVVFVYAGEARSVAMAGDANAWSPDADGFDRLEGTSFWWLRKNFAPDARLDYKLVVNDSSWMLDPRNERTSLGGFGPNTELRMPGYKDQPETVERPGTPRGSIVDTVFRSAALGNERVVRIYLPPGYASSSDSVGLIVVHDGLEFISIAGMPTVLDNLLADGSIPPVIAVFIPPVDRTSEYAGDRTSSFSAFIAEDIVPVVMRQFRVSQDPAQHVVMGASNGGNISLALGGRYPSLFGKICAFSTNVEPAVADRFRDTPRLPVLLYLDLGTYDIPALIPRVHSFLSILSARGYRFRFTEFHDGHSWSNWKTHIDDALIYLLSGRDGP